MSLPRAVIEAEQKANELLKAMTQPPQEAPTEVTPPTETPVETPPSEPVGLEQPSFSNEPPPSDEEPAPADTPAPTNWEQQYKTLAGKYSSEVPRLAAELREMRRTMKNLEAENHALRSSKQEPAPTLVKPEEIQEYGEPLVDLMRRAAREELSQKDAEIQELRSRLDSFSNHAAENREVTFWETLASVVPDWEAVNGNPDFHKWLAEFDELTGKRRQDLLAEAQESMDAPRVSKFFNSWKKTQQSRAATSTRSLEQQIVPDNSRAPAVPKGKKIWTRGEIQDFYMNVRRGSVPAKDAVAIEADIHQAQIEGRIR